MRTQDFLQQAANNLRQAAQARKAEVDDLRRKMADQEKFERDQTNLLKQREAETMAEAAKTDSDELKASHAREAQVLRTEESQISQETNYQKRQLNENINVKQRNIDELNQMAQNIESNWMQL